ncbi:MAG: riboflavin synthase [Saprospiraceae bacterium]|nr:riboflavin synthase [Saprospiraceae bacterium]
MFTGIIESQGIIANIRKENENIRLTIHCKFIKELKIDQSVALNGVCLTVVDIANDTYDCVVIPETISKTNLSNLRLHDTVNLERAMLLGGRFDGHFVQGHVDCITTLLQINNSNNQRDFIFEIPTEYKLHFIPRGSITINGVSLTIANVFTNKFQVSIIPYTFENTTFKQLKIGASVNLEFDLLGKYILNFLELKEKSNNTALS